MAGASGAGTGCRLDEQKPLSGERSSKQAKMGNRHDKPEIPKLEGLKGAIARTVTRPSPQSQQAKPGLAPPPDGHKRRASAPLWPSISPVAAHRASPRFRASPSQWLFGDWGMRVGARESPGRPPCPSHPPPPRQRLGPRRRLGLPAAPLLGGSKDERGRGGTEDSEGRREKNFLKLQVSHA